ncbi:hypothetical protein [Lewinella sp. LCG006]|uniref:hypothetical protein n=1 Tax=Lewinella sp. LCG006 TaxID=3231911 RepID=UPI0034615C34
MIGQRLVVFTSLLSWLPFLLLCLFVHPLGTHEWDWISNWGGVYDGWDYFAIQQHLYDTLGGRYSSNFLLSLTSSWYSLAAFRWLFVGNLLLLLGSTVYLFRQVFPFLHVGTLVGLAALSWSLYFEASTSVYEDIYRFTVVVIYQFGLAGNLLAAALLIRLRQQGSLSKMGIFLLFVLFGFTAGLNEISLVFLILSLGAYIVAQWADQKKVPLFIWGLTVFLAVCAWVIVASPGNVLRAEATGVVRDLGKTLIATTGASGFLWAQWLGSTLLIPSAILLLPFVRSYQAELAATRLFGRPWLWLGVLLLLLPMVWLPVFYGSGLTLFPEYIVDMLYFAFQFCFFATLTSFMLLKKWQLHTETKAMPLLSILVGAYLLIRLFAGDVYFDKTNRDPSKSHWSRIQLSSNIGNAWLSLLGGDASAYSSDMQQHYIAVAQCRSDTCQVAKPGKLPFPLYDPLYDRRDDGGDPFMCWYFQGRPCLVKY